MARTSPTPITALGTPPSTSDPTNFDTRADALFGQLPTTVTEINALGTVTYNNAVDAYNSATTAAADAASSAANAALASAAAGAILWVSGTTYAIGDRRFSPTNGLTYRRLTVGAGTTDPAADTTNWQIVQVAPPVIVVTGTTQTAVAGYLYALTNVAATTVTLPASPATGDMVQIKVCNGLSTNLINPNGGTIEGVSGNMTLDNAYASAKLIYISGSWRTL